MSVLFTPRHMPCTECGCSVDSQVATPHICAPERLLAFTLFCLQASTAAFAADLTAWLGTPHGGFERWLAARTVVSRPGGSGPPRDC